MVPSQANAAAEQMPANIVSLCREFWYAILDDDEIWYHDNLNQMLEALEIIGAYRYAERVNMAFQTYLKDVVLPIDDDKLSKSVQKKLNSATIFLSQSNTDACEEFIQALARYIKKYRLWTE